MSLKIGEYIRYKLLEALPTISSNPVIETENDEQLEPYIVYNSTLEPHYTKDGIECDVNNVNITIVHKSYTDLMNLAQIVRDTFELKIETYNDIKINSCYLLPVSEATSDGLLYSQVLTFEFNTN